MDNELLNSCSNTVQSAIRYLEEEGDLKNQRDRMLPNPIMFYVLDQVGSDRVQEFLSKWRDIDFGLGMAIYEQIDSLVYLLKLEKQYNPQTWKEDNSIQQIISTLKSEQMANGAIELNEYSTSGAIWILAHFEPDSDVIQNAIDYIMPNANEDISESPTAWYLDQTAVGSIALSELNIHQYEREINKLNTRLISEVEAFVNKHENNPKSLLGGLPYAIIALNKSPANYQEQRANIAQRLRKALLNVKFEELPEDYLARAVLGLIHDGGGPKVSAVNAEWEKEMKEQELKLSQPELVSTFPAPQLQTRKKEIYEKSKRIINNSDDELRVSTLRIDMLYEDIIDIVQSDVNTKILTRSETPSGERKRLKKAVKNELIEETADEIRGGDLIHARMIIGDRDELLVSSADLTRDQLYDQFNVGLYTRDDDTISDAIDVFDEIWQNSEPIQKRP